MDRTCPLCASGMFFLGVVCWPREAVLLKDGYIDVLYIYICIYPPIQMDLVFFHVFFLG